MDAYLLNGIQRVTQPVPNTSKKKKYTMLSVKLIDGNDQRIEVCTLREVAQFTEPGRAGAGNIIDPNRKESLMRWIKFPDGGVYTLANDIQKLAEEHGYVVPCERDGTRHPGTDCNAKMRAVVKDVGMRRTFRITDQSVVDVRVDDTPVNIAFIRWLVDQGIVNASYLKIGAIQLYTEEAVNALISVMLKTQIEYDIEDDEFFECGILITKRSHNFEKKKNRPKASLFKK